jgi:hypothetical protein
MDSATTYIAWQADGAEWDASGRLRCVKRAQAVLASPGKEAAVPIRAISVFVQPNDGK